MDSLKQQFMACLDAREVDPALFPGRFVALAADEAFLQACIRRLEAAPVPDGFSRLAQLLFAADRTEEACALWQRDIRTGTLSWWQYTRYMEAVFRLQGEAAASRVAEQIEATFTEHYNGWGTLGLLLQPTDPRRAVELMERDARAGRLTPGFRLNYACVLAAVGRLAAAIEEVEAAYRERPALRQGFSRLLRSAQRCTPQEAVGLLHREWIHDGTLPAADDGLARQLLDGGDLGPVLAELAALDDLRAADRCSLFLLECTLRLARIEPARQVLAAARQRAGSAEPWPQIEAALDEILGERAGQNTTLTERTGHAE